MGTEEDAVPEEDRNLPVSEHMHVGDCVHCLSNISSNILVTATESLSRDRFWWIRDTHQRCETL